jgi:hypothetical protein
MPWAVAAAAVAAGGSAYAANKQSKAAKDAAKATAVNPIDINSPFGTTTFENGQANAYEAPNPFSNLFGSLGIAGLSNAGVANSMPFNGANGQLIDEYNAANAAAQPGSNEFNDVLTKLRAVSAPEEQRQNVALDNQQFSRGMLGTTGGAERFRALKESQAQADLQRQLQAQGITTQNANDRFNRALTTVNQGMSNQQQQFNIGTASSGNQMNMWQQLLNQMGVGIAAGGGQAPGAAMYAAQQASNVPLAVSQGLNGVANAWMNRAPTPTPTPSPTAYGGYPSYQDQAVAAGVS